MNSTTFLARHYNVMTGFPGRIDNLAQMIEPWVREWNVRTALDAGCGGGALMFALDRLGVEPVGLDLSESMLRLALDNARAAGKAWRFAGAPFQSAGAIFPRQFDVVFVLGNAFIGLEGERAMRESLDGLRASLKPGGHILIQNLNFEPFFLGLKRLINRRVVGDWRYLRYAVPLDDRRLFFTAIAESEQEPLELVTNVWQRWDRDRMVDCLHASGFTEIAVYGGINRSPYEPRSSTDLVLAARG